MSKRCHDDCHWCGEGRGRRMLDECECGCTGSDGRRRNGHQDVVELRCVKNCSVTAEIECSPQWSLTSNWPKEIRI